MENILNNQVEKEKEACPICGKLSNWVTEEHCYCAECYKEFNPITGNVYRIGKNGRLIRVKTKL